MKLLKLAPEATRLRRVSRAYASGDISRSEYREVRRDIIAGFGQDPGSRGGRALIDETQRRNRASDASHGGEGVLREGGDTVWWLVGVVCVAVLVATGFATNLI